MASRQPYLLKTLDQFLDEDAMREEVTVVAIKRVIAFSLIEAMKNERLSKAAMAGRMGTSRRQLDRILDPNEHNVTLDTLARAAHSVGKTIKVELI
jgi:antitoxin HicB